MKNLTAFILIAILISCTGIADDEIANLDFPGSQVKIPVILSRFSPDSVVLVTVGTTQQAFDENAQKELTVKNATIENIETGLTEALTQITGTKNRYGSDIPLTGGAAYRITLEFPGISKKTVTATDTIPFASKIKSVKVIPGAKKLDDNLLLLVQLEIMPPALRRESFYEITVFSKVTDTTDFDGFPIEPFDKISSPQWLYSDEPVITREAYYPSILQFNAYPPEKLLFNKQHLGKTFLLEFYYSPPSVYTDWPEKEIYHIYSHLSTIYLKTVSESYYRYETTRLRQFYARTGDPLYGMCEPINVYSNINNGTGIFAAYTTDTVKTSYKAEREDFQP